MHPQTHHGFPPEARVRKRGAFVEIQRQGKKVAGKAVLMFVHPQRKKHGLAAARLGVTVSRRVGIAVVRNRIKRILREVFRLHSEWFDAGRDYVLVARPGAAALDYVGMCTEVERLCSRAGRGGT